MTTTTQKMKRAIINVRVSSDEQTKGYSPELQEEQLRSYCKLKNIEIVALFKEDHSAKTFDRPEYKKMEALAKKSSGKVDYIFFTTWDRFSRNAAEAYQKIALFNKLGIEVQAIDQPIDFSIPANKMMLAFYLSFPEVENDMRSQKILGGVRAAKKEGRWLGKAPFGYRNERDGMNKPIIVPDNNARLIAKIFQDTLKGASQAEIRSELKGKGIYIGKSRFSVLVRSRVYMGEVFVRSEDSPPGYYVKGLHAPIVSEDVFYKVQEIVEGKKLKKRTPAKYNTVKEELFLRGHLNCPHCGNHITGSASKGRNGRHFYYHCNHCKGYRIKVEEAHQAMEHLLSEFTFTRPAQKLYELMVKQLFSSTFKERRKSKDTLQKEVEELEKKLENLDNKFAGDAIDTDTYYRLYGKFNQQLQLLKSELDEERSENAEYNKYLKSGINLLSDLKGYYGKADVNGRKKLLGSIFPENLQLSKSGSRTVRINEALRLMLAVDKGCSKKKSGQLFQNLELSALVEATGIEPVSKHDVQKLSTCLVLHYLSGSGRSNTNQPLP